MLPAFADELGEHLTLQRLEDRRVAEEAGDADENVGVEVLDLSRIFSNDLQIVAKIIHLVQRHAPPDPTLDGARFVVRQIEIMPGAEKREELTEVALRQPQTFAVATGEVVVLADGNQLFRHFLGR